MINAFVGHLRVAGFPRPSGASRAGGAATGTPVTAPRVRPAAHVAPPRLRPTWSCTWVDGKPSWSVTFTSGEAPDLSYLGGEE